MHAYTDVYDVSIHVMFDLLKLQSLGDTTGQEAENPQPGPHHE